MEDKLTIFVSSIIGELLEERKAIKQAIEAIPLTKSWVFEHTPASADRLDESYLSKVRECDVFVLLMAKNISHPVRREYETALADDKPRFVFLKDVERTSEAHAFIDQIDVKWSKFNTTEEMQQQVQEAVTDELIKGYRRYRLKATEMDTLADFMERLSAATVMGGDNIQVTIGNGAGQVAVGKNIVQTGDITYGPSHKTVFHGSVTGPVHTGSGNIVINPTQDLETIFAQLRTLVATQSQLPPAEREEITAGLSELGTELAQAEPDLGKIQRLKKFLVEKGPWLAAGVNTLFINPSVVEIVKQATQRLLGG